jgi:hypothetical protein
MTAFNPGASPPPVLMTIFFMIPSSSDSHIWIILILPFNAAEIF